MFQLVSVSDGTEQLKKETQNMAALEKAIYDYKWNHIHRNALTKERLSEMMQEVVVVGKDVVKSTDEKVRNLLDESEPFLRSGVEPGADPQVMLDKCIELTGSIAGIKLTMEKNAKKISNVYKNHKKLSEIEKMVFKTVALQEKLERNKRFACEHPEQTSLHQLIVLSTMLLSLDRSPEISDYYKKKLGEIETRIAALFDLMSDYVPSNIGGIANNLATQSSLSNGEINLQSINDDTEVPVDTSESF